MDEPPSSDVPNVERPPLADKEHNAETCFVCGLPIDAQEQVARLHEATTHYDCYHRDEERGH